MLKIHQFKGILLDIDNTLYSYQKPHEQALSVCLGKMSREHGLPLPTIEEAFFEGRKEIKFEVPGTAAAHNRLLYFQRLCEKLKLNSLTEAYPLYQLYWDHFLECLTPDDFLYPFLELVKEKKIALVTDLTADIQFRKVQKLRLFEYANVMVSSEEVGHDKPHPHMALLALHKLKLNANDVIMIGDNFQKDILCACSLGIQSVWLNTNDPKCSLPSGCRHIRNLKQMCEKIEQEQSIGKYI